MFVRKRDPRYKAHHRSQPQPAITPPAHPPVPQTQTEPVAVYVEQEWQKTGVSDAGDLEWALAEGNDDPEVFECVACGKSFKSEAAWNSHERSKRHIKNVEVLRRQMEEEAKELGLSGPNDGLGSEPTEDSGQSEGSVAPSLDDRSGTEDENPHYARESPEYRAQVALVEETSPEGIDESQSEQKLSKKEKRRLREAKKQAQAVNNMHASVWKGHADIRLTTGHRNVTFAKQNSRAGLSCLITSEAQATRSPSQRWKWVQRRGEREGDNSR